MIADNSGRMQPGDRSSIALQEGPSFSTFLAQTAKLREFYCGDRFKHRGPALAIYGTMRELGFLSFTFTQLGVSTPTIADLSGYGETMVKVVLRDLRQIGLISTEYRKAPDRKTNLNSIHTLLLVPYDKEKVYRPTQDLTPAPNAPDRTETLMDARSVAPGAAEEPESAVLPDPVTLLKQITRLYGLKRAEMDAIVTRNRLTDGSVRWESVRAEAHSMRGKRR